MYKRGITKHEYLWHQRITWEARKLRSRQTPAEVKLWNYLKQTERWNCRFRRQFAWHNFILDFYCRQYKLVIEVDGEVHANPEQLKKDQFKNQLLKEAGFEVIRFTNEEVLENTEAVLKRITSLLKGGGAEHSEAEKV